MEEQLSTNRIFEQFIDNARQELSPDKVNLWVNIFETYFRANNLLTYNELTVAIYSGTVGNLEIIQENWSKIMEHHTQWSLDPSLSEKFKKVEDHILLAITQRSFILDNVEILKTQLNQKSEELNALTIELETAKKTVESLKDIKTRIYTEFVSILGIFTAVVLGAFGSLQVIGSVFSNIKNVPTGKLLVFSSLTSIGVMVLLFLLMRWINRIVNKDASQNSWGFLIRENLIFFIGIIVLMYMFVIGFLLYTKEPKSILLQWYSNGIVGIITFSFITLTTIIILIYSFVLVKKNNEAQVE